VLSHWPIRTKLKLGLGLLAVTVLALFASAYYGLYAYRELVRGLAARSAELPKASQVIQDVSNLRLTLTQAKERFEFLLEDVEPPAEGASKPNEDDEQGVPDDSEFGGRYRVQLGYVVSSIEAYRLELEDTPVDVNSRLADDGSERQVIDGIHALIEDLQGSAFGQGPGETWFDEQNEIERLLTIVEKLQEESARLPSYLHTRLTKLAGDVRSQYRTAIVVAWTNVVLALVMLVASRKVFYKWFADPLQELVAGSRRVAAGHFEHRIVLATHDELSELADAMNAMTNKFCHIRDDLDQQVRERTSQVVRSEQLASVGFLAAGVSHEINNPLASIALCSESLEARMHDLLDGVGDDRADEVKVVRHYLQMIQREAFRCKQITEKLLDFARRGDSERHATDLRELAAGVIEMVQHLGKYHDKRLELLSGAPVLAAVNPQEMKQVMLNLMTNGLESLDAGGRVAVSLELRDGRARVVVEDNGCGMTEDVLKHLFEPFYTRRRTGQGIGLGLSITHRIVEEHGGHIDATSEGAGRGSRFVVSLPALQANKESNHRRQVA
jgi:two-component system, NtrC family, sensor kinase